MFVGFARLRHKSQMDGREDVATPVGHDDWPDYLGPIKESDLITGRTDTRRGEQLLHLHARGRPLRL